MCSLWGGRVACNAEAHRREMWWTTVLGDRRLTAVRGEKESGWDETESAGAKIMPEGDLRRGDAGEGRSARVCVCVCVV